MPIKAIKDNEAVLILSFLVKSFDLGADRENQSHAWGNVGVIYVDEHNDIQSCDLYAEDGTPNFHFREVANGH